MGALLSLLGWISPNAVGALLNTVLGHFEKKADRELDGFKAGSEADTARLKAYLDAQIQNNNLKLAQNSWWGAKLIILMAGLPMAAHMAAVALDTLVPPFGSWGVPRLPPPYDGYERDIVMSFFLVMPAMPLVGAASTWLRGRR